MSQPTKYPDTGVDDTLERPPVPLPTPPTPTRNRRPSRCYNFTMIVAYFGVLIIAVVALGSFGKKQDDINRLAHTAGFTDKTCILFATTTRVTDNLYRFELHSAGLCGYVLWGLVSVTIVVFVWLVYSIVLTAIGPKVISILRILDLVLMALTCLLSISLSITIHSGLDATCKVNGHTYCGPLTSYDSEEMLEFYDELNTAKVSSWITSVLLLALSVWYTILIMIYCYSGSQRRRQAQQYAHLERQDRELPDHV